MKRSDLEKLRDWAEQSGEALDGTRFMELVGVMDRWPEFKRGVMTEPRGKAMLLALAVQAVRVLANTPPEATVFFRHALNNLLRSAHGKPVNTLDLPEFDGPLGDTEQMQRILESLQKTLIDELGDLPHAVLILQLQDQNRTIFAANSAKFKPGQSPRATLHMLLESAAERNRGIDDDESPLLQ